MSVKTKSTLWCWSGTKIRIPTITATPNTCQPTEMLLKSATSGEEKMLISAWASRITTNSTNVSPRMPEASEKSMTPRFTPNRFRVAYRNVAAA